MTSENIQERIAALVGSDRVVLFMKGDRTRPQCGFSATVVGILDDLLPSYTTVNVLADPAIREGVKAFSQWPTIPQLYINGEFVGGCDIVRDLQRSGELHTMLGVQDPAATPVPPPTLTVTAAAAAAVQKAMADSPVAADGDAAEAEHLRLEITPQFEHGLSLGTKEPGDIEVSANGLRLLLDRASAKRANGLVIDFVEGKEGGGFKIDNPNAPRT